MKIERVSISGFRSFSKSIYFDFTSQVGVVRLGGRNLDEPSLGANGAGKSSLWDAVYWCLYGKTAQGLKGPEVASWGASKPCSVSVTINGAELTRTWGTGNNILTLNGEDITQGQVDKWVGLSAEQFMYCTYMAQHGVSFLDLGAQAKTDLIASILGLDYWLDMSKHADKALSRCTSDLNEVIVAIGKRDGAIETLLQTDYVTQEQEWALKVSNTIARLNSELKDVEMLYDKAELVLCSRKDELQAVRERMNGAGDDFDNATAAEKKALENALRVETRIGALKRTLDDCDKATCPVCEQPWPKHLQDRARHVQDDIADAKAELRPLDQKHNESMWAVQATKLKLDRAREAFKAAGDSEHESAMMVRDHGRRCVEIMREVKKVGEEESPFVALIADKKKRLTHLRFELEDLKDERSLLEAQSERLTFWVKGFKDIRLFLVTEALEHLEVEVNSALMQLGLADWSIKFAPDSETKAGSIKRGFSVMIESPSNERPVPWAVWSGGEAQRLRLACTMGLSNLITSYTGYQPFVEVWDEATAGLSPEGVRDMLHALDNRAQAEGRQVWAVDHHALESGVFCDTVFAVKQHGTTLLERTGASQGE